MTTNYGLPTTDYGLRTTDYGLLMKIGITCYPSYGGSGVVGAEL